MLPTSFNNTWIVNTVRLGKGGESAASQNDEVLYFRPARTYQTDSHPVTNFPRTRTWATLAGVNEDICSICKKEKFDRNWSNISYQNLPKVIVYNRLLDCPSCNNHRNYKIYVISHKSAHDTVPTLTLLCLGKEKSGLVDFDALLLAKNVVWKNH
jgi:hypothetical protein